MESPPPSGTLDLTGLRRSAVFRRIMSLADRRSVRFALAFLWTALICVLCWTPKIGVPPGMDDSHLGKIPHLDKAIHATLFFGFGVLWCVALPGRSRWAYVMAGGLALAVLTEYVQGLPIVGRDTDFWDGVADTVGLTLGTASAVTWLPNVRRGPRAEPLE